MPETETEAARSERLLIDRARDETTDIYALLSLPSPYSSSPPADPPSASALKKAWRQAALKWHPDKNPGREAEAANKLDEIRKAYDILENPAARSAYDEKVRAKAETAARQAAMVGRRRRMVDDLETREKGSRPGTPAAGGGGSSASTTGSPQAGQKRKFGSGTAFGGSGGVQASSNGDDDAEYRRLAAEGARRRQEKQQKMEREREEASRKAEAEANGDGEDLNGTHQAQSNMASGPATPAKKFSFATPNGSASKTGVGTVMGTPGSASMKERAQSTMQRLREAQQRRQSGLQESIVQ